MKIKNLLLAALFAVLMVTLAACGSDDNNDSGADGASDDEEVTLHLAELESAYGKEVWVNIIDDYEAKHENVTIELTAEKNLAEVVRRQMQARDYADIYLLATDRQVALKESLHKESGEE